MILLLPQQPPAVVAPKPAVTNPPNTAEQKGLSSTQIEALLKIVPVFSITDVNGKPLVSPVPDATKSVTSIFITPSSAKLALAQFFAKRSDMATKIRINPVSLWDIYKVATNDQSPFLIQFISDPLELDAAKPFVKVGRIVRIPLFVAKNKADNGLLMINQNGQEAIPLFFSKRDLDDVLRKYGKPELLAQIDTDVIDLQDFMDTLTRTQDTKMAKVTLVPAKEAMDFVRQAALPKQPVSQTDNTIKKGDNKGILPATIGTKTKPTDKKKIKKR